MVNFYDEIDEEKVLFPEDDPVMAEYLDKLKRNSSVGTWEIARNTYKMRSALAGSGTKEELVELEENLRDLIKEGIHGYTYIEKILVGMGYNQNKIRHIFKRITGTDPEIFVNPTMMIPPPPGNIPTINYGWGYSKDKKYESYFIMPFDDGYAVFGQKDDMNREMIRLFPILSDARDFLAKKVKEVYQYDAPVKVNLKQVHRDEFVDPVEVIKHASAQAQDLYNYFETISKHAPKKELIQIANSKLENKEISLQEYKFLADHFGLFKQADEAVLDETLFKDISNVENEEEEEDLSTNKEEKEKIDEDAKEKTSSLLEGMSFKSEIKSTTPREFVEDVMEKDKISITELLAQAENYFKDVKQSLVNYELDIIAFKFLNLESKFLHSGDITDVSTSESKVYSDGVFTFIFNIRHKSIPNKIKKGFNVFVLKNRTLKTDGMFKGEDDKIYSLTEEGLDTYFEDIKNEFLTEDAF